MRRPARALVAAAAAASLLIGMAAIAAEPGAKAAPADGTGQLMQLVAGSDDAELQRDVLRGVHAALEGRRQLAAPAGWDAVYDKLGTSKDAELRSLTRALAAVYGDRRAIAAMRETLADAKADADERRSVLQSLLAAGEPTLAATLHALVGDAGLRDAALAALASFDDVRTPGVILAAYETLDVNARRVALNTLAGRLTYARELVAAVKAGRVPKQDLTAFTIRQLRDLGDATLNAFVDELYGVAREASADKAGQIAQYKEWLTDDRVANANPARGRAVFTRTCAQCHALFGTGGTVGPDLTGSQRANLDYVLQNVIDPSSLIAKEFQVSLIRTKDKRTVSGIATETDHAYKVVSETGTALLPKDRVEKVKKSDLSMMPEGLLNGLSETEVADLVAYLRAANQVPLPEAPR